MIEWARTYPWIVYAVAALALAATIVAARACAISPRLKSWGLFAPRAAVLGGLLFILLNPVRLDRHQLPPRQSQLAFLTDSSKSMALDAPTSRLEQVKQVIYQAIQEVPESERPRLHLYSFGERLKAAPSLPQLQPLEDASRFQDAFRQLPSRFGKDVPKAVVIFSDGQWEGRSDLNDLVATYAEIGVAVHVFPVGDVGVRGDVAIQELVVPRRVQEGEKTVVRATIRSNGFDGKRAVVTIRPEDSNEPLASLPITLSPSPETCELVVEANRNTSRLLLEVSQLAGEAITENNQVPFQLSTGDRKLKVLYMEGTRGREYSYIHNALVEDPDIECLSMVVDQQYVARPRLQRVGDPYRGFPTTREELFMYDVVICSDISQGAFTREQMAWTVELVGDRGGGFAMIGGHTSFGAGRWDQTSWDKLIPVDMSGGNLGRGYLTMQFGVQVPDEALNHPIWQLLEDPVQNRRAVASMPKFYGTNLINRLKPAATLLGQSAVPLQQAGIMPVFAVEKYGRGRTFALSSDSTAYWGQDFERYWGQGDNRYFRKFWRNVVRWLSESSIAGSKRLLVDTDKIIYRPGESIKLKAVAYNASYEETTDYRLVAQLIDAGDQAPAIGAAETLTANKAAGRYESEIKARLPKTVTEVGEPFSTLQLATVEVVATYKRREVARTAVDLQILNDSRELANPQPALERLTALASQSGGRVLSSASELGNLLREFPSTPGEVLIHRSPIWDRYWFWGAIIILLGVEWSVRRLVGFG